MAALAGTALPAAAPSQANIEFIAFDGGCRFFDTRRAGGSFSPSEFRDLSVRASVIPGQGGSTECGVPDHSMAVDASMSTIGNTPSGSGFVRAGAGGTEPKPTVLQFLKNQGISVTTTVPLETDGTTCVKVFQSSAGNGGDLLGYWQRTLHATVDISPGSPDPVGAFVNQSGALSVTDAAVGFWVVTFEGDINESSPIATANADPKTNAQAALNGPPGQVFVRTTSTMKTATRSTSRSPWSADPPKPSTDERPAPILVAFPPIIGERATRIRLDRVFRGPESRGGTAWPPPSPHLRPAGRRPVRTRTPRGRQDSRRCAGGG